MKRVNVTEFKNRLSHYLRMVKRGVAIEIVERQTPIARLSALVGDIESPSENVERMIRDGVLGQPKRRAGREVLDFAPIRCRVDAVQAVVESRGDR